jgi:hypothetical protein
MRPGIAALAAAVLVAACGGGSDAPFGVLATSEKGIGIGHQRVMISVLDPATQDLLAAPDREATVEIRDENGSPLASYPTEFLWTVEGVRGLYVAYVDLPKPGTYQAIVEVDGLPASVPVGFNASEDPPVIEVGETAPLSKTRTSDDTDDLATISSDPDPDPDFYRLSIDEAVGNGTPSVIVFATPAWCVSQTCGPMLDQAKSIATGFPDVDFVHVEVYEDIQVETFEELNPIDAVDEWGLPSEPWIFVVEGSGRVTAAFEGVVSDSELTAAIDAVAG